MTSVSYGVKLQPILSTSPSYLITALNGKFHSSTDSGRRRNWGFNHQPQGKKKSAFYSMVLEALILIPHYKWDPSGQIYFWHKSVYFKGDTLGKNLAHFKLQFKAAKSSWRDPENFFFITFTISILCLFTLVCHDVNYQPLKTNKKYHHSKCKLTTRTST